MTTSTTTVVVLGAGAVGVWTARALLDAGVTVRMVSRSGRRPALLPPEVDLTAADLGTPGAGPGVATGAAVVVQALNPPYHRWTEEFPALQTAAMAAARDAGARYVSVDNLYMYGKPEGPLREDSHQHPDTVKGRLRAAMARAVLAAHARGDLEAAVLRSSDYYGPLVTGSALGERMFAPLVTGKRPEVAGSLTMPHSYAYIEDVGRAAAALALTDTAYGRVWFSPHAPAATHAELVAEAGEIVGRPVRPTVLGRAKVRVGGLFVPEARAMVEMMYEFTAPFTVDAAASERELGLSPTPLRVGLERTIAWYRDRS